MSHPERIVPDEVPPGIVALHLKRYEFAEPWCEGKDVLDVACGAGYGSAHLARVAAGVVGVDVSEEAIAYARRRYAAPNLAFHAMDAERLDLPESSFDVVVSFETVEHLADQDAFLRGIGRVLRDDGRLLVSTPHVRETTRRPANPYHRVEYSRADFEALLRAHFGGVELYGQRRLETRRHRVLRRLDVLGLRRRFTFVRRASRLTGTAPTESISSAEIEIARDDLDRATELLAVCSAPRR